MTFLTFLSCYSLLLVLNSFFILGWWKITRHQIVVNPDNSESIEGYVGKMWSYFWEKTIDTKRTYYRGNALIVKYHEIKHLLPKVAEKLKVSELQDTLLNKTEIEVSEDEIDKIERLLKCQVLSFKGGINLYLEEDIYLFPSWVRSPLSYCVICMSSVYGSAGYWAFVLLANGAFDWTLHKNFAISLFFPTYILILSCISTFLSRKIN